MSKADLKAAMDSLQVKKPLRLPAAAPAFKAPPPLSQDVASSQDTEVSPELSTSQDASGSQVFAGKTNGSDKCGPSAPVSKASEDAPASLDAHTSQDQEASLDIHASTDQIQSQDAVASGDRLVSEDVSAPQVAAAALVPRATQPRRATEQDRAVTEAVSVKSKLSTGYTRVPNSILMEMVAGDLSRNEMKILLLIARMTISFNRSYVPLSKGVIERMTGVQGRSVLEALQTLVDARLIEKRAGDHNSPNRFGLIFDPLPAATQVPKASEDATGTKDLSSTQGWGADGTYKKDSFETVDLRKKIPLSSLSEPLRRYFAELKPRRKREAEFEAFGELRTEYSEEQIENCLTMLQTRGIPTSGAVCHSPMAYLAKAMSEVVRLLDIEQDRKRRIRIHQEKDAEAQRARAETEAREAAAWSVKERAFRKTFASESQRFEVLGELCRGSLFRPNTDPGRVFGIDRWWDGLNHDERDKFTQ